MAATRRTSGRVSAPATYNLDVLLEAGSDEEDERYVSAAESEDEMSVDETVKSESEDEEFTLSKKKVSKKQAKTTSSRSRKACPFSKLPMEILTMILSELHPSALYHLAFSSKQFYALLSSEAARSIWRRSRACHVYKSPIYWSGGDAAKDIGVPWEDEDGNMYRLMPSPVDLTELAFAHLCYSNRCWICGSRHKSIALFALGIRACIKCRRDHLLMYADIHKLGKVFKDLLDCLPWIMKDGAADDPDQIHSHRFWDTQVDRLRLRLYDVERTKRLEGNLSVVPYPSTEQRSLPGSPLSALSDEEGDDEKVDSPKNDEDVLAALKKKFFQHETDRVERLQTFATICSRVESAEATEQYRAKEKQRTQAREQRSSFRQAFIEHVASVRNVSEEQVQIVLDHAGPKTRLDKLLQNTKICFEPEHYSPFDGWMTSRLTELASAQAEHDAWHNQSYADFRCLIQNAPSFASLLRAVHDMSEINEADFFALPTMQDLLSQYADSEWTIGELRRAFLSVRDAVLRDIEAFSNRIRQDLHDITQEARRQFAKTNKAAALEATLPPDDRNFKGIGFVCRECHQPIDVFPGVLSHGCVKEQKDQGVPLASSTWREYWVYRTRARSWDPKLIAYDIGHSQAAWAMWNAVEKEDAGLACTTSSFKDLCDNSGITYSCDLTCDRIMRNVRAKTMFKHLISHRHTSEEWCIADLQSVFNHEEDSDDDDV